MEKESLIIEKIKLVFDPEIPVNVYDLGLIYDLKMPSDDTVVVLMTLTSPSCSMAGFIVDSVHDRIAELDFVKEAQVDLTWDPPWNKTLMSEEALLELGFL